MTCPFCQNQFDATAPARCPECGCEVMRLTSGLVKTSAVLIASDDQRAVYRSVQDVPEPLRKRLMESTQGINSATIVIADHGGREHMEKHLDNPAQPPLKSGGTTEAARTVDVEPSSPAHAGVSLPGQPLADAAEETVLDSAEHPRFRLLAIGLAAAALAGVAAWMLHGVQW